MQLKILEDSDTLHCIVYTHIWFACYKVMVLYKYIYNLLSMPDQVKRNTQPSNYV